MDKTEEIRSRFDALRDEIVTLDEAEQAGTLTPEQEARLDEALTEFEAVQAELAKAEERDARKYAVRLAPARERAVPTTFTRTPERDIYDLGEIRGLEPKARNVELRARAVEAIEKAPRDEMTAEMRETATRHAERNPEIAEHILMTGSPDYRDAFNAYVTGTPLNAQQQQKWMEQRAAMSLTGANGGFLVPFTLDPTIILTNNGTLNPFRGISTIKTITTDDWNGVSSAGVTAEWLSELSEAADASPTFAQPSITVQKAAAYLTASIEVNMDANLGAEISGLIADAKDRLEGTAFAVGTGSGQPYGIVTELQLVTASRVAGSSGAAGAADFVAADVYAVDNALPPRARQSGPSWLAHHTVLNSVRQMGTTNNYHAFWTDFGAGMPPTLLGYPVYQSSDMDSTVVSGSNDDILILGDFKQYAIVDRVGLAIAYNPLVVGATYGRPTGAVGWFAFWRVGARTLDSNAFRMLRL